MSVETEPFIGKQTEYPVSYNTRDLITYAIGIGCTELNWVYENNKDFAAFPTYPIVLFFKGDESSVVPFPSKSMTSGPKGPRLPGVKVGLDAEKYIEKVNELPSGGANLRMRQKLLAVTKKGSGALTESELELVDESGKVYYRMVNGGMSVGAKDFKDGGKSTSISLKPPAREPDAVEEEKTSPFQAQLYRLSGDYNPLHVDPVFAGKAGFSAPIMHGLCTLGHSTRHVMKHFCDNRTQKFKAVRLRFASPVIPGDTLVTKMWKESNRVVFTTEVKETGKVVISNAFVELHDAGAKL